MNSEMRLINVSANPFCSVQIAIVPDSGLVAEILTSTRGLI
jgi:hypothetical protein